MTAGVPAGRAGRERDPFGLPSGTTARFVLLITAVTTASATLVNSVSSTVLTSVEPRQMLAYYQCATRATQDAARARSAHPGSGASAFVFDCHDPRAGTAWAVTATATALLLLSVGCVYVCLPAWRSRRRGYRELTGVPELSAYLEELTRTTGLYPRVTFLAEPLEPSIDALAFGRARRRQVVLSGGLMALFARDRDAFRSVVLHELAHIRNRDLDVAFLTLIVWRMSGPPLLSFAVLAVPGSLAVLAVPGSLVAGPELAAANLTHAVRIGLLAVLAAFLKNSVLRSRELHADARVRSWEGSADSLLRLFRSYGLPSAPRSSWRSALLRVHPTAAQREGALRDERLLDRAGFWDFCAVGATAAFLYDFLELGPIGGGSQTGTGTEALATALASALLVGATGTALWRGSAGAAGTVDPARIRNAGLGLALGAGVLHLLSPTGASSAAMLGGRGVTLIIPYAALVGLSGLATAGWLAAVARSWTALPDRWRRPRLMAAAVLGASAAGLAPAFDYLMQLPPLTLYAASFLFPDTPGALVFVSDFVTLSVGVAASALTPLTVAAVLIPIAGQYVAGRAARGRPATGFGPLQPTAGPLVRLGVPVGLAAAGMGVLMALLGVFSFWGMILVICAAQIAAALWATRDYAPLPVVRGLLAAYGSGALALLGWFLLMKMFGSCALGAGTCAALPSPEDIFLGLTLPSPGALAACAVHAGLRTLGPRPAGQSPRGGGRRGPGRAAMTRKATAFPGW
ncbi:M48 family metalloprotease [Streptomyces sp. MI02-7b]|uniref:M48 family metalloprotease n=1 Tax=Streptomyces sp. MI02-7b TaxID=462941 RepID=UPI0029AEE6A6|nr:M48 family metalloprotease [Streptomyces sp. MI02-7b]MDX3076696.1 M48 family metalloprotease [Streptomyces sp. MI02-7b]